MVAGLVVAVTALVVRPVRGALGVSAGVLANVALGGAVCFLFLTPVLGTYMDCKHQIQIARLPESSVLSAASDLV